MLNWILLELGHSQDSHLQSSFKIRKINNFFIWWIIFLSKKPPDDQNINLRNQSCICILYIYKVLNSMSVCISVTRSRGKTAEAIYPRICIKIQFNLFMVCESFLNSIKMIMVQMLSSIKMSTSFSTLTVFFCHPILIHRINLEEHGKKVETVRSSPFN